MSTGRETELFEWMDVSDFVCIGQMKATVTWAVRQKGRWSELINLSGSPPARALTKCTLTHEDTHIYINNLRTFN